MSDTSKLTALGNNTTYRYDNPVSATLEVFDNQHPLSPYVIGLECTEFTSLCPMTGQPDWGVIQIVYVPDKLCIESKSLKLYLGCYRNHGSFHEDCVNQIADDICIRISPLMLRVYGDFNSRGGIAIKPLALRRSKSLGELQSENCYDLIKQYDQITKNASS